MKAKKVRIISTILYFVLALCPVIAAGLGITLVPVEVSYADYLPIPVLEGFLAVWFAGIACAFLLPVVKRIREEKGKDSSDIVFGSGTMAVIALASLILFGMVVFTFFFYLGLRCGTFHAS